jgi:hypothetical protein
MKRIALILVACSSLIACEKLHKYPTEAELQAKAAQVKPVPGQTRAQATANARAAMGPSREYIAYRNARNREAFAYGMQAMAEGFNSASNSFAQVADTHRAIGLQQSIDNANMTNFINGQMLNTRMSTMNTNLFHPVK